MSGLLPPGWTLATLPEIAGPGGFVADGDWVETKDQDPTGPVRLTQLADIGDGEFKDRSDRWMSEEAVQRLNCTLLSEGDVLIARMPDPLGRACVFPRMKERCVTAVDVCVVRAPGIVARCLMLAINSPTVRSVIAGLQSGSTRKRISRANLCTVQLPVPPLREQERIVAEIEKQFTRLDEAVATLKAVQAKLKRARASVLKAAVEGRLVPTEAELARVEGRSYEPAPVLLERILAERRARWPKGKKYQPPAEPKTDDLPELPEGWTWASPAELADGLPHSLGIGPFGSDLKVSDYQPAGVPLVFVRNIRTGLFRAAGTPFVSPEKAAKLQAHQVRPADILITKMGDPPGDSWVYPAGYPPAIMTADCIRWRIHPECGLPWFFAYATRTQAVRGQVLERTQGVAQKKLSLARFGHVAYPVAPPPEQARIVAEIERRASVIANLEHTVEQSLARCGRLRQSILKRAFEGKLAPQDPSDEPAGELLARIRAQRAKEARA